MTMKSRTVSLLFVLLLAGCATDRVKPEAATPPKQPTDTSKTVAQPTPQTSETNYAKLIGAKRQDLIAKLGQPNMTMDVTLIGRPPSEGFLYYPKNGTGCVHTFVVIEETGEIIDYFCR